MSKRKQDWQKQSKLTRSERVAIKKREIEVIYGFPFETVREVFKFAFCVDGGSSASLSVYEDHADIISNSEFKRAYNRYMRRKEREKYQMIAWVGVENLDSEDAPLATNSTLY